MYNYCESISMPQKRTFSLDQAEKTENVAKKLKTGAMSQLESLLRYQPFREEEELLMSKEEFNVKLLLIEAINGSPQQRIIALGQLDNRVQDIGVVLIFDYIITWLMQTKFKDEEMYFLMKVMHKLLHKLDGEYAQLFAPKVIVVVQPFLVDDCRSRMKGRDIIYDLSKIAGLDAMTALIGAQANDESENIRDMAAKAFGVVASALGISAILPFLKCCCQSKESWRVRHTGIRMVEQIAVCTGCTLLPHVKSLVDVIEGGLAHKDLEVVRITALSLAALANAVSPYGCETFKSVFPYLFDGARGTGFSYHSGNVLAALVKLYTCIIPLMDPFCEQMINPYRKIVKLLKEPDEEAQGIALQALKQLANVWRIELSTALDRETHGLFRDLWGRTTMLSRKNYKLLVDATIAFANKLGAAHLKERLVGELEDHSSTYKEMVIEIIEKALACVDASEDDVRFDDIFQDMALLFCWSF